MNREHTSSEEAAAQRRSEESMSTHARLSALTITQILVATALLILTIYQWTR